MRYTLRIGETLTLYLRDCLPTLEQPLSFAGPCPTCTSSLTLTVDRLGQYWAICQYGHSAAVSVEQQPDD